VYGLYTPASVILEEEITVTEERKPMSFEEVVAAALELPEEERVSLLEQVEDSLYSDEIDPADVEDHHRIIAEINAGRMKTVPAEQVLDMLEAAAMGIPEDGRAALADRLIMGLAGTDAYDPMWLAELNRRIDEAEAGTSKTVPAEEVLAKMKARRDARPLSR
jgi:hypothetical protein